MIHSFFLTTLHTVVERSTAVSASSASLSPTSSPVLGKKEDMKNFENRELFKNNLIS